jgi:hypothetical protein
VRSAVSQHHRHARSFIAEVDAEQSCVRCRRRVTQYLKSGRGCEPQSRAPRQRTSVHAVPEGARFSVNAGGHGRCVRHVSMLPRLAAMMFALVAMLAACSSSTSDSCTDEDARGGARCQDSTSTKFCREDSEFHLSWLVESCPTANPSCATTSDGTGVCAKSVNRAPECVGRPDGTRCTTSSDAHRCQDGFLVDESCDQPGSQAKFCISPSPEKLFCALASTRDPRCGSTDGSVCDGTTIVDCLDGYAVRTHACATCTFSTATNTAQCS